MVNINLEVLFEMRNWKLDKDIGLLTVSILTNFFPSNNVCFRRVTLINLADAAARKEILQNFKEAILKTVEEKKKRKSLDHKSKMVFIQISSK